MNPPELESFVVLGELGRGGRATVFRARHRATGQELALKVLDDRSDLGREGVLREARALASLSHPAVLPLWDVGGGDTPWLAMPVAQGTLAGRLLSWTEVRSALAQVLAGLSHAHARGVIHGDVKPSNVLLVGPEQVALSDFGLAQFRGASLDEGGTPAYMAPELFSSSVLTVRSDLYATGCLGWALVTGHAPFGSRSWAEARLAHEGSQRPTLRAGLAVPDGLEDWLLWLLARDPAHRPRSAAEARQRLLALNEVQMPLPQASHAAAATLSRAPGRRTAVARPPSTAHTLPPRPSLGSCPSVPVARAPAAGLGVGLLGLRAWPVVGREREQERLWTVAIEACEGGVVRQVRVVGGSGSGKSGLLGWLGEAVAETGAMRVLRVRGASSVNALAAAILEVDGTRHEALEARLPQGTAGQRKSWLSLAGAREERFGSRSERVTAAVGLLEGSLTEPVLLLLDDVVESSELGEAVLGVRRQAGALAVVWSGDGRHETSVDEVVVLPPVPLEALADLLCAALSVERPLALRLAAPAEGSPRLATRLLQHHAERAVLRHEAGVWRVLPGSLRDGPDAELELVDGFLAGCGATDAVAILVLAALPTDAPESRWRRVLDSLGLVVGATLAHELHLAGLAVTPRADEGWRLASGEVRAAVLGHVSLAAERERVFRACAESATDPAERGRHLLRAGAWPEALEFLRLGARARLYAGDAHGVLALLDDLDDPLIVAGQAHTHEAWWRSRVVRAHALLRLGDSGSAEQLWTETREAAQTAGWTWTEAEALDALANLRLFQRRFADGEALARRAVELSGSTEAEQHARCLQKLASAVGYGGRPEEAILVAQWARAVAGSRVAVLAQVCFTEANQLLRLGRHEEAERRLREARRGFVSLGVQRSVANVENSLGELARARGELGAAMAHYEAAAGAMELLGPRTGVLPHLNLALLAIEQGLLDAARDGVSRAIARAVPGTGTARMARTLSAALRRAAGLDYSKADLCDPVSTGEPEIVQAIQRVLACSAAPDFSVESL